ncbi:unnamed protein product [Rotaria magnacalcarata]|uniref:Uncharacterized protein n=1 Tax=Rotaria magnacalcarata TaxID=392030 RepID=A0A820B797_9BILA|nr:unnamed protein product [Rotaria magnacalcarata]
MNTEQRKKLIESLPIHSYFRVGDKVLFQIPRVGRLNVDALKPYYEGPYTIRKVTVPNKCFIIQHDIHKDIQKRADHDQLRKFKTPPKYLQNLAIFQELMMTYHPKHLNPNNDQIEKTSLKIANDTVNMLPTNTVTITTDKKTERSEERPMWKIMELQKPNTDSDRESTESDSSLNDEVLTKTSTRSTSTGTESALEEAKEDHRLNSKLINKTLEVHNKMKKKKYIFPKNSIPDSRIINVSVEVINESINSENEKTKSNDEVVSNNDYTNINESIKAYNPKIFPIEDLENSSPVIEKFTPLTKYKFSTPKSSNYSVTPPPMKIPDIPSINKFNWDSLNNLTDNQLKAMLSPDPLSDDHPFVSADRVSRRLEFESHEGRRGTYTIKTHGMRTRLDLICYNLDMKLGYYEHLPM